MKTHILSRAFALSFLLASSALCGSGAAPATSTVPAELVGKWRWTTISGTNYTTPTGQIEGGGGMSASFIFTKDGHYKFNFYVKMRTYNLVTESNTTSEGTVVFSQNQFTLRPTKGHYLGWNSGKKTVDRDMTAAERQKSTGYFWKWVKKDGNRALMIGPAANTLSHFKPE